MVTRQSGADVVENSYRVGDGRELPKSNDGAKYTHEGAAERGHRSEAQRERMCSGVNPQPKPPLPQENVQWQTFDVNKQKRAELKGQDPFVLWFTGLSGAGKSTVANLVERRLHEQRRHTYLLDGDNVRHGLNRDLGFSEDDRIENIRRIAEVARLFVDAGLIVLTAFISPFGAERAMARRLFDKEEFFEVFLDTPLAEAERRDPKGLYRRARSGELKQFTGIDSPYERPEAPEIHIDTLSVTPADAASRILAKVERRWRSA